jgi:large subunit ribosomal protein LX
MTTRVWRVQGEYRKNKRTFEFVKELIASKESHAEEWIMSDLGSRHRVKRKDIEIKKIEEIQPRDVQSLELRTILGVESDL